LLGIGLILLSIFGRRVTSRDESKRARVQAN